MKIRRKKSRPNHRESDRRFGTGEAEEEASAPGVAGLADVGVELPAFAMIDAPPAVVLDSEAPSMRSAAGDGKRSLFSACTCTCEEKELQVAPIVDPVVYESPFHVETSS